ncbi:MAG: DMT family transporter [Solirubrobacterales bacterium]
MSHSTRVGRIDMVATAACLGALACWSTGPVLIKYLAGHLDSWTQNALRYSVACLFWLPFLAHSIIKGGWDTRPWRRAILPSLVNVVMQSLWATSFYYIDPAFVTLLTNTSILWVAGFSLLFFVEERPLARSPRFWLSLLLSVVGIFGVVVFKENFTARGTAIGIVVALAEAFMWGIYAISVRVAFRGNDPRSSFAILSIYTVVELWICSFLFGQPQRALELGVPAWAAVVVSGITAIALAHVLFYTAIHRIGTTIPTLVNLAQPFVVFGLSSYVFHERLNGIQLLFGGVLLAGSGLSVWAQQHLRARTRE